MKSDSKSDFTKRREEQERRRNRSAIEKIMDYLKWLFA